MKCECRGGPHGGYTCPACRPVAARDCDCGWDRPYGPTCPDCGGKTTYATPDPIPPTAARQEATEA